MEVEHIARVGLASGWTAQNQGNLAVGHSLLGKVVIDHKRMPARVAEIFAYGCARKWCVVLHGRRVCCSCGNHYGVVHSALVAQGLDYIGYGGALLSHGNVDTIDRVSLEVVLPLVDDGVDGEGRLSCLTVADNQLSLATANWNHGVHALDSGLERLVHRLAENHSRGLALEWHLAEIPFYLSQAVKRVAQRIDHAADHLFSHTDGGNTPRAGHSHSLLNLVGWSEQYRSHIVLLQVHSHRHHSVLKTKQFSGLA